MGDSPPPLICPAWLDDLGLTATQFRVYCHLRRRAGPTEWAKPGLRSIAKTCRLRTDTVQKALRELETFRLIDIHPPKKQGETSEYWVSLSTPIGVCQNGTYAETGHPEGVCSNGAGCMPKPVQGCPVSEHERGFLQRGSRKGAQGREDKLIQFDEEEQKRASEERFREMIDSNGTVPPMGTERGHPLFEAWLDWYSHVKGKTSKTRFKYREWNGERDAIEHIRDTNGEAVAVGVLRRAIAEGHARLEGKGLRTG